MTAEWRATTLGECVDLLSGGTPSKEEAAYWDGDIPWVSAKDMGRFLLDDAEDHVSEAGVRNGTRLAAAGTPLLLVRGMTLHSDIPVCLPLRTVAFNQDVKALRPRPGVLGEYIAYWLVAQKAALLRCVDSASHGTGRLQTDLLERMAIHLPIPAVQAEVAGALRLLDDRSRLSAAIEETLRTVMERIFVSWFVTAEGRPHGLDECVTTSLADLATYRNGGAYTQFANGAGKPILRIRELNEGVDERTPRTDMNTPSDRSARFGDVLFAWSGSLDVYLWTGTDAAINQHIFKVLPVYGVPPWFVFFALKRAMRQFRTIAKDKTTTMGHIQRGHLRSATVPVPGAEGMRAASEVMTPLWDRLLVSRRERDSLADLRAALLRRLMRDRSAPPT